jgi:hypothetical protein
MPQNSDDEVEVLVQAGYATSTDAAIDALKNQKLRRLLDETSDFVERYLPFSGCINIYRLCTE